MLGALSKMSRTWLESERINRNIFNTEDRPPQCIAHRGFKLRFPENSELAFREAVKAGAHGLETDVHLTKDGVVVLSHDATLQRCFGHKTKIIDCTWKEIQHLKTITKPHVPIFRLEDLLRLLAQDDFRHVWLLLDVKLANNPEDIMRLVASTIATVPTRTSQPWDQRIVLGLWSAKHFPLARHFSPGFRTVHIGLCVPYARRFFAWPGSGFNMLLPMLMAPGGHSFIRACRERYKRPLLAWTVNDPEKMKWCILNGLNGVITDDPVNYMKLYREHQERPILARAHIRPRVRLQVAGLWLVITFFSFVIGPIKMMRLRRELSAALTGIR